MVQIYSFLDAMCQNAVSYDHVELELDEEHPEYETWRQQKSSDEKSMNPDEFIETYIDQIPKLNGCRNSHEWETKFFPQMREFRDSIDSFKMNPTNRQFFLVRLQQSSEELKTLGEMVTEENARVLSPPEQEKNSKFNLDENKEEDLASSVFGEATIPNYHIYTPLLGAFKSKSLLVLEVIALMGSELSPVTVESKRIRSKDSGEEVTITKNQVVLLFHFLQKHGAILKKSMTKKQFSESIGNLTNYSNESLRQSLSDVAKLSTDTTEFSENDLATVKRLLDRIIKDIEHNIKNL